MTLSIESSDGPGLHNKDAQLIDRVTNERSSCGHTIMNRTRVRAIIKPLAAVTSAGSKQPLSVERDKKPRSLTKMGIYTDIFLDGDVPGRTQSFLRDPRVNPRVRFQRP